MKWITEKKFDRMFDACEEGLIDKDGSISPENFSKLMERQRSLEDYHVIGLGIIMDRIREKVNNYKLFHPKLGKVKYDRTRKSFHIENISRGILWQTDRYLAVIIRDYLRNFISQTPAIWNCILKDYPNYSSDAGGWTAKTLMCDPNTLEFRAGIDPVRDDAFQKWVDKVNEVADDFDAIRKILEGEDYMYPETEALLKVAIEKAFDGLKFIFQDLNW